MGNKLGGNGSRRIKLFKFTPNFGDLYVDMKPAPQPKQRTSIFEMSGNKVVGVAWA